MSDVSDMSDVPILMEYLTVPSAYKPGVIPGRNAWTFLSRVGGIPQMWALDEQQTPFLFMEAEDRILSVFYHPQGTQVVVGVDRQGNEKQQIWIADLDDQGQGVRHMRPLVQSAEHFHHIGGWSKDGKWLSYSSNRRAAGAFDVWIVDVHTGECRIVFEYTANCVPLQWVDDETLLIRIQETNLNNAIYMLNIHTGEQKRIGPDHPSARYESVVITGQGNRGYVLTDLNEETLYVASFATADPSRLRELLHVPRWDIEHLAATPTGEVLAFHINEGGISQLGLYFTDTGEQEMIEVLPKGVVESPVWLNEQELLFTFKSAVQPGDIWKYHRLTRELVRLTRMGESEQISSQLIQPSLHQYESFDGLEVPYFLYTPSPEREWNTGRSGDREHSDELLPAQSAPLGKGDRGQHANERQQESGRSAVIYVHGGPEGQTRSEYHPVMQYLVSQGFVVAAPNVRGSLGYGRTYVQLDDARKRMDSVQDLAWLVKDLIARHNVHPERIGIMGRSYGGFMVLAAVTHYPELWAAGVDIVGISNLKTLLQNTGEWRRKLREYEYGSLEEHSDFFDEIAPLHHSGRITAPLLVFHGRNDTRVPVSEAEQLVHDMKTRNQEVELIIFEDEGHQTERLENHITMHSKTVEFFARHLQ